MPSVKAIINLFFICSLVFCRTAYAEKKYSPSDVYSNIDYASRMMTKILDQKGINNLTLPTSYETAVKPMHVYELNVAVIAQLYKYSITNKLTPPPLTLSSPIKYSPSDVYYLTEIVTAKIESIYDSNIGNNFFYPKSFSGKTPKDVYSTLFQLYSMILRLRGLDNVSPNEVYAQTRRAKIDLQSIILTLSKRLDNSKFNEKRLLVTAAYGMHTDGSTMSSYEKKKTPKDIITSALNIRKKINLLKTYYKIQNLSIPTLSEFSSTTPSDAFLQTQYMIAEINLLKIPLGIHHSTDTVIEVNDKTPSDVYQEMKHISYLLDRLISQKGVML